MSLTGPYEAVYLKIATAFTVIQAHAKEHGEALSQPDKEATKAVYTCDRAGKIRSQGQGS